MEFDSFYFNGLPKFADILKLNLKEALNKTDSLTVMDHINIFFDFFEKYEAQEFLKEFNVTGDEIYTAVYFHQNNNRIYLERDLTTEDYDEEFQIQFELILNISFVEERVSEVYEVKRDGNGKFSNWEIGTINFEEYKAMVYSSKELIYVRDLYPIGIRIGLNADI